MANKSKPDVRGLVPDLELWNKVAEIIKPLRNGPYSAPKKERPVQGKSVNVTGAANERSPEKPRRAADFSSHFPSTSPDFTGLDRRTRQRLTRGQLAAEASVDLHGLTAAEARSKLVRFLADARSRHLRLVLVITGKGASPYTRHTLHGRSGYNVPERSGRIRKLLPQWLSEPEISPWVNGFQPAHPRHGGGGAFYILLKRKHSTAR